MEEIKAKLLEKMRSNGYGKAKEKSIIDWFLKIFQHFKRKTQWKISRSFKLIILTVQKIRQFYTPRCV